MATKRRSLTTKKTVQRKERRAAFAETTPRAIKRAAGATTTSETPLHVRAPGLVLEDGLREYARQRTGFRIGKFGLEITRVSVRFEDISGPKGAPVYDCRIKVVLRTAPDVMVSQSDETQRAAFDKAVGAAERAVRRTLERKDRTAKRARAR
ncbi:MAG: HPF/RaiA family ribosome-associated protein [Gemmatimonadetes bacterium]|nr:HPF/RaiA family ribosome-associated protein [Gemmatimonadota bacterium]MCC6773067.1 HPF/RaiA family ribosome-associated protein [Gemmatimonadaceae bacterium]